MSMDAIVQAKMDSELKAQVAQLGSRYLICCGSTDLCPAERP